MTATEYDGPKFIIALGYQHALNTLSVWVGHPDMRATLEVGHMFDTAPPAHQALADMIQRAEDDGGCCEPDHFCGRCVNWPPSVYEVQLTINRVTPAT